jgi:hypothetical protein
MLADRAHSWPGNALRCSIYGRGLTIPSLLYHHRRESGPTSRGPSCCRQLRHRTLRGLLGCSYATSSSTVPSAHGAWITKSRTKILEINCFLGMYSRTLSATETSRFSRSLLRTALVSWSREAMN